MNAVRQIAAGRNRPAIYNDGGRSCTAHAGTQTGSSIARCRHIAIRERGRGRTIALVQRIKPARVITRGGDAAALHGGAGRRLIGGKSVLSKQTIGTDPCS